MRLRDQPVVVLFLNRMWDRYPDVDPGACAVPCEFVYDSAQLDRADAVVVHLPTAPPLKSEQKRPGQVWVAFSMESEITTPLMNDRRAMEIFDLEVSYRRSAGVWMPYVGRETLEGMLVPPPPKTEPYPVAHFQSNSYDRSGRNRWLLELIRRTKVASYGSVMPTVPKPRSVATREDRLAVSSRHKFTLAFENSIAVDYVTDKLFDVLVAGSVPVYLGAPNVADFAPAPHSYIDVNDFSGPDELASYINHLDRHNEEYEAYLAWKRSGPADRFVRMIDSIPRDPFCRVAEFAHAQRRREPSRRE
jgi:hypothetical protein